MQDSVKSQPHFPYIETLRNYMQRRIMGQERLIDRLLIAILADGHLLVEGAPGLAKTKAIKTLSDAIECRYQRIQFTPDLLPSDITGTEIYRPQESSFAFQPGPIFHNLVLADEINRAPAKVQSALLEAMAERQVSIGKTTHDLPELFLVMATQNPIEQEGTYPLPEAQLDRFLMQVNIGYPSVEAERKILKLARQEAKSAGTKKSSEGKKRIPQSILFGARQAVLDVSMVSAVEEYIVQLIAATREPERYDDQLAKQIEFGASPRATIALDRCARAHAWLAGRDYVTPEDVQQILPDVLRHRLGLSFSAEAAGVKTDDVITDLLRWVSAP